MSPRTRVRPGTDTGAQDGKGAAATPSVAHRANLMRSCGKTWLHLRELGLTSEVVAGELRRILREGQP